MNTNSTAQTIPGLVFNHNQTVVRPVTRPVPGLVFNHNQTLVRR